MCASRKRRQNSRGRDELASSGDSVPLLQRSQSRRENMAGRGQDYEQWRGLAIGLERIVRSCDERPRRLDYGSLWYYLGRESPEYDRRRPGPEPCVRHGSWPYDAHNGWRRNLEWSVFTQNQ